MSDYISINGQLTPYDDARIAPFDAGLLHGAGLFETLRVRNGKIFRGAEHLARITASAAVMNLPFTLGLGQLQEMMADLLEVNGLTDARARLTITRGDLHEATAEQPEPPVTLMLSASAFAPYPAALYEKGLTAIIAPYKQNPESPLCGHKTTSYVDRLMALREAQKLKAGEALWFAAGTNFLAEGSISNVFIVDKDGVLATPPLHVPEKTNQRLCLPGITRQVVLGLATEMNVLPHERMITITELLAAKEVFVTNAIMGVMPVTHIEKHNVGNEKPGELTMKLHAAYNALLETETD